MRGDRESVCICVRASVRACVRACGVVWCGVCECVFNVGT